MKLTTREYVSRDIKEIIVKELARELREGLTEEEKRERRRWTNPINGGTWGHVHAWILFLGGYLD